MRSSAICGACHESLAGRAVSVRPHAKSHKCPQIALQQIALGAVGVCCQKVSEAEALVEGGVGDVLVANEVVGAPKLRRLAALAKRARVAVCADDAGNVAALDAAAREAGVTLDVLVEINVGANRCGVEPGEPALELAQQSRRPPQPALCRPAGLPGRARSICARSASGARRSRPRSTRSGSTPRAARRRRGIPCDKVTGAGTGTYLFEAASAVYHELQPGSYIFMDADYARNDWTESGMPRFEHSLFVWTTVMSRPARRPRHRRRRTQGLERRFRHAAGRGRRGRRIREGLRRARRAAVERRRRGSRSATS